MYMPSRHAFYEGVYGLWVSYTVYGFPYGARFLYGLLMVISFFVPPSLA